MPAASVVSQPLQHVSTLLLASQRRFPPMPKASRRAVVGRASRCSLDNRPDKLEVGLLAGARQEGGKLQQQAPPARRRQHPQHLPH